MDRLLTRKGAIYYAGAPDESPGDENAYRVGKIGRSLPASIPAWVCLLLIPVPLCLTVPLWIALPTDTLHPPFMGAIVGSTIALAVIWVGALRRDRNRLEFDEDGFRWRGSFFSFSRIRKVLIDSKPATNILNPVQPSVIVTGVSGGVCRELKIYDAHRDWSVEQFGIELTAVVASVAENAATDPD